MAATGRLSRERILTQLKLAARKGDRTALQLALGEMRSLALTPKYWTRYLSLLTHPLARLVDLLVIKQGERIAHQKGWAKVAPRARASMPRARSEAKEERAKRRRFTAPANLQPLLFPELDSEPAPSRPRRKQRR